MLSNSYEFPKARLYCLSVSLSEVVDDLLTSDDLARSEDDPDRRRSLALVRSRLADRDRGARVSEAAQVLGLSQPTVRAWIEAGVLEPIAETGPVRVDVRSVADVKRSLDLIRRHKDDRRLLSDVARMLRDRAALAGDDIRQGLEDLAAGRTRSLDDDLLAEIDAVEARGSADRKER